MKRRRVTRRWRQLEVLDTKKILEFCSTMPLRDRQFCPSFELWNDSTPAKSGDAGSSHTARDNQAVGADGE